MKRKRSGHQQAETHFTQNNAGESETGGCGGISGSPQRHLNQSGYRWIRVYYALFIDAYLSMRVLHIHDPLRANGYVIIYRVMRPLVCMRTLHSMYDIFCICLFGQNAA